MFSNVVCVHPPLPPYNVVKQILKTLFCFHKCLVTISVANTFIIIQHCTGGEGEGMVTLILALSCKCFINLSPRLSEKWQKFNVYNYTFLLFSSDIFKTFFSLLNLKWTWQCMLRPISFFHKEIFVYCIFNPSWHVFVLITYYFPLCYVLPCITFCC